MERALDSIRVRAGGLTAQCPHCEAHDFNPTQGLQLLACASCGAHTGQAELFQQIARNARLVADVLAQHAKHVIPLPN